MTKANLKKLPIEHFTVTSSEITAYLQNLLGIPFDCDYILYDNRGPYEKPMATEKCYAVMRCVFRPEDITVKAAATGYVDMVLAEAGSNMKFKDTVIDVLTPFMFPENFAEILRNDPQKIALLNAQGLYGEKLETLMRHPRFFYDKVNARFGITLRPECIIRDMASDPATNTLDGIMSFGYVSGDSRNAAAITWGVNVYKNTGSVNVSNGVSIDQVFSTVKKHQ